MLSLQLCLRFAPMADSERAHGELVRTGVSVEFMVTGQEFIV